MEISNKLILDIKDYNSNMQKAVNSTTAGMTKIQSITNQATNAIKSQSTILAGLKNTIAPLLTIGAIKGALSIADDYQKINATIKNATSSVEEFNYFQQVTKELSQSIYKNYGDVASQITALIPPMKAVGASAGSIKTFISTLNQGFRANAFTGGEAVVTALAKSFNKGTVDAKAFQQVLIAIPDIASNIATVLGKTEQEIKELGKAGQISVKDFINAVNATESIYKSQSANVVMSIADSFVYFKNSLQNFIGESKGVSSASAIIAKSVKFLADNIGILSKAFLIFGGIKAFQMMGGIASSIALTTSSVIASTTAWNAETVAIMRNTKAKTANAIIGKAQGAGLAVNSLNTAGTAIASLAGAGAGLNRVLSGTLTLLGKGGIIGLILGAVAVTGQWENAADSVKYIFDDIASVSKKSFSIASDKLADMGESVKELINSSELMAGFFSSFDSGIFGLFELVGRLSDIIAASIKTLIQYQIQSTTTGVKSAYNIMMKPVKLLFNVIEASFNKLVDNYNKIASRFKLTPIDFKLDMANITDKLELKIEPTVSFKQMWNDNLTTQRDSGLEAYFRQMKQDIELQREINKKEIDAKNASVNELLSINDSFAEINQELNKNAKGINNLSATDMQIDIEKLYQSTDFANRNSEFYNKINDLQTAILQSRQAIDWNEVSRAMGIGISSQVGILSTNNNTELSNTSELLSASNLQVQALNNNTIALNNLAMKDNSNIQSIAPAGERPIVVKIIGNIDNMEQFIKVQIEDYNAKNAVMNLN